MKEQPGLFPTRDECQAEDLSYHIQKRMVDQKTVLKLACLSRSQLARKICNGDFPRPLRTTSNKLYWEYAVFADWLALHSDEIHGREARTSRLRQEADDSAVVAQYVSIIKEFKRTQAAIWDTYKNDPSLFDKLQPLYVKWEALLSKLTEEQSRQVGLLMCSHDLTWTCPDCGQIRCQRCGITVKDAGPHEFKVGLGSRTLSVT